MHCWLAGIARAGDRMADSVADILPGSIPRGAAKVGIIGIGSLIAFSLIQKVHAKAGDPSSLRRDLRGWPAFL